MRYVHIFYSNSFSKEPFIKNDTEIPINRDRILLLQVCPSIDSIKLMTYHEAKMGQNGESSECANFV